MTPKQRVRLDSSARQTEILDATRRLVAERGFRGITIDRVAEVCGLTRAGLLHHFPSKAALLTAVLERQDLVDQQDTYFDAAEWNTAASCRAHLDEIVRRDLGRREIVKMYTVLSSEALTEDHPAYEAFQERLRRARLWLRQISAGWHPDPDGFALQYLSFMNGLHLNWLRDPSIDLEREWGTFADALFDTDPSHWPTVGQPLS